MKTNKELQEIMLENQEFFTNGICDWLMNIKRKKLITWEETEHLVKIVQSNKPEGCDNQYYWPKGELEPRIKWIKEYIV